MKLTKHALERMAERGITKEEIKRAMVSKTTVYRSSNTQEGVFN